MSMSGDRLPLAIDVFSKANQQARILPNIKPPEFIRAILQEFRELEFLGSDPTGYQLRKAEAEQPLQDNIAMTDQITAGDHLTLVEIKVPTPPGALPAPEPIYLREQSTEQVFRIPWLPAIIGRYSDDQPLNELVAADLTSFPSGMRVSRRNVKLARANGEYQVESISSNPVLLIKNNGGETSLLDRVRTIEQGDSIRLERSGIELKFIVRGDVDPNNAENQ